MKKAIRIVLLILMPLALLYFGAKYFFGGDSGYNSIYLVPEDAVLILELEEPMDAWNSIVYSDAWYHLSQIESISDLNSEILSADSLVSSNRVLLKLLGKRKITLSIHQTPQGKTENLIIVDVGKAARIKNFQSILDKVLGEDYNISHRMYKEYEIIEVHDRETSEMMYMSFLKEKMIFSFTHKLIEKSIDETGQMTIGRDLSFIDVSKRIAGKGLFNVYIQYKYLPGFVKSVTGSSIESVDKARENLSFSGLAFDIDQNGLISLEGYSSLNPDATSAYGSFFVNGKTQTACLEVVPQRVASLVKINFDDASEYLHASLKSSGEEEYQEYLNTLRKTEKKLDISLDENLLSWMDKEILLLQTQPSNLGRDNEFAVIIKAKNNKLPVKNFEYIEKQIQKNSPVKIKRVDYEGFEIHYISFPGILKALFGKIINRLEKPYYTIIDDHVIFSNHPQTIKNIINDYKAGSTLEKSIEYNDFSSEFKKSSSAFSYFDVPVLFNNLKAFVDAETWRDLNKNKEYITSFSQIGLQTSAEEELIHFQLKARYQREVDEIEALRFTNFELTEILMEDLTADKKAERDTMAESTIIIPDLDASDYSKLYEDGTTKIEADLKNGLKHGTFKEYYKNGELKVKGKYKSDKKEGTWKYYDWEGNLIKEELFKEGNLIEE